MVGFRLPTVWGGRPGRAAAAPGGESRACKFASPRSGEVGPAAQRPRRVGSKELA